MPTNTTILEPEFRSRLLVFMREKGTERAAHFMDVSAPTLDRAAHGMAVLRGTAALLRLKLAERTAVREGS